MNEIGDYSIRDKDESKIEVKTEIYFIINIFLTCRMQKVKSLFQQIFNIMMNNTKSKKKNLTVHFKIHELRHCPFGKIQSVLNCCDFWCNSNWHQKFSIRKSSVVDWCRFFWYCEWLHTWTIKKSFVFNWIHLTKNLYFCWHRAHDDAIVNALFGIVMISGESVTVFMFSHFEKVNKLILKTFSVIMIDVSIFILSRKHILSGSFKLNMNFLSDCHGNGWK